MIRFRDLSTRGSSGSEGLFGGYDFERQRVTRQPIARPVPPDGRAFCVSGSGPGIMAFLSHGCHETVTFRGDSSGLFYESHRPYHGQTPICPPLQCALHRSA